MILVWAVSTLTMLALAGILPDFRPQAEGPGGDSLTRIGLTAARGAGAFGLPSALVWPLIAGALLLVPALVLGLLVFFLNGSLLLIVLGGSTGGGAGGGFAVGGHAERNPSVRGGDRTGRKPLIWCGFWCARRYVDPSSI